MLVRRVVVRLQHLATDRQELASRIALFAVQHCEVVGIRHAHCKLAVAQSVAVRRAQQYYAVFRVAPTPLAEAALVWRDWGCCKFVHNSSRGDRCDM